MKPKLENLQYLAASSLETIVCPLCAGSEFKTLVIEQGLPVVRCLSCRLTFVNPRPGRVDLDKFYENYFPPESESLWQEQMSQIFFKEGLLKIKNFEARGILKMTSQGKILDVGCGMGFFLDLMRNQGWEASGVEPASNAVRHATEKLKLNVQRGILEEASFNTLFDVVTLWYVLEHVPNPGEIIARAASYLRPGGIVIIRVPNQNAVIDQWLSRLGLQRFFLINPPRHLFDYSPASLSEFLRRKGFEVLEVRNSIPRATGTWLELLRRYAWYGFFEALYYLSGGKIIRGSSITVYAKKK